MKKIIFIVMSLLLVSSSFAYISRVYQDTYEPGYMELGVTMHNSGRTLKNTKITAYVPYIGAYGVSNTFRLRSGRSDRVSVLLDIDKDTPSGYYPVILTLNSDDGRDRTHSWIYIS